MCKLPRMVKKLKEKNVNGDTTYEYKLLGFDKDGKEKEIEFTALKNLRKEAFLRIYYSEKKRCEILGRS